MTDFAFDNTYARLPERFFARLDPTPPKAPRLLALNRGLAAELGLDPDALAGPAGVAALAGGAPPRGAEPLAMAYAGHQFGNWVPQLGDGRALLLGEVIDRSGRRRDIQLKGSGRTPFSRMGDGRAAIGPVLREFLIAEAMHALGVPTTRALAAVATGETVLRERPAPGAVLTRVASSHLRVGTFQFFAGRGDVDGLRRLADYAIARHYPEAAAAERPARALLDAVVERQARLVAAWMAVGFIHGVMNTDNMSIAGETIDFGPCAFLDAYHPATVFSSIDQFGRYAYANQPPIAHWNLAMLASALLPLLGETEAEALAQGQAAVDAFADRFAAAETAVWRAKLGLAEASPEDLALARDLLERMAANGVDFTNLFRALSAAPAAIGATGEDAPMRNLFVDPTAFDVWAARWRERLRQERRDDAARHAAMQAANPAVIPRNHLVEAALAAAAETGDLRPFHRLSNALATPYAPPADAAFTRPPEPGQEVRATFCGT